MKIVGSFRFNCLLKCTTETDFYNMVFNAHSENVLLFSGIFFYEKLLRFKSYYDFPM